MKKTLPLKRDHNTEIHNVNNQDVLQTIINSETLLKIKDIKENHTDQKKIHQYYRKHFKSISK